MGFFQIKSERLALEISDPGCFYKGSRFDWTGFITQIVLDGKYSFCIDESQVPGIGTGGRGLCNEFGIHEPVGYEDARVGESFPKLGIGLLTRDGDGPYEFFKPYEVKPFRFHVETGEDRVRYTVDPVDCRGYSAKLQKEISVSENSMKIEYCLENTGRHTIDTTEYVHNFVNIGGLGVNSDNRLTFSFVPTGESKPEVFHVEGSTIAWKHTPDKEFYWAPQGFEGMESSWWELVNIRTGVGMREMCDFPVLRAAIWGKAHVVSPELFIKLRLEPGCKKSWTRTYEFFVR